MADAKVTLKSSMGTGNYYVYVDGVLIGEVRKKVTRYNLRRVIVDTTWYAITLERKRIPEHGGYGTRRNAVAALVKAVQS